MCPAVSSAPHCTASIDAPPSCGACSLPTGSGFDVRADDTVVVGGESCAVADSCAGGEAGSCSSGWRWLTVADVAFVLEAIELPQHVEAFARCAFTAAHWHEHRAPGRTHAEPRYHFERGFYSGVLV